MNRREFIRAGATGLLTPTLLHRSLAMEKAAASDRPNILLISTDQQFCEAVSCLGNTDLKTPNIDRIAAKGVFFRSTYASDPICVPSRTSYMTGCMPHETGVTFNHELENFPLRQPCGAQFLRSGGYDTGHVGKWHIPRDIGDNGWSGFNYIRAARNNRVDFDIVEPCLEFINRPRKAGRPFFLVASFVNPHDICEYARMASGIEDEYKNGDLPAVPEPAQCPALPDNLEIPDFEPEAIRRHQQMESTLRVYPTRNWGQDEDGKWRQYRWAYYRMIELVDGYIGELLDGLEASGKADNTVILFISDHGDGMGAHRWNQKTLFYEETARVPFIVSWPGRTQAGTVDDTQLVNLGTDLFPTVLDFAGIDQPGHMKGISMRPFSEGRPGPENPFVVSQNNLQPAYDVEGDVNGRMLRTRRYKYVKYSKGRYPEQLFDLLEDPGEMVNLAVSGNHAAHLAEHRQLLAEWMRENGDPFHSETTE